MARRAHAYPQVDQRAESELNAPVAAVAATAAAGEALRACRRRNAPVVAIGDRAHALRDDLVRASLLGLEDLPALSLARPLPVVDREAGEVRVRRLLADGARAIVVRDRRGIAGAIVPGPRRAAALPSLAAQVRARLPAALAEAVATVTRVTADLAIPAYLAGGLVRDLLRGGDDLAARDVDVVVEGDGLAVARALAIALGVPPAGVVEHDRFLTASLDLPGGGRIDVATARSERYETPGALPRVLPATIEQDLLRRDFTVNAMAVELASGAFGLLDPLGGRAALVRRRLAVLHPLSFAEDPTRMFRAARYGARLGFALDAWSRRAQALALRLAPYPALSGTRLTAEIELIAAEPTAGAALERLAAAGVFRLLDSRYRATPATAAGLRALDAAIAWARTRALRASPLELALAAVLADQAPDVREAALRRLGLTGEPLARLARALDAGDVPPAGGPPSARAARLRDLGDLGLAVRWLRGDDARRAEVDWFVDRARHVRPALGGDEVVALGVPRGPEVARALAALRDARLDGAVPDREAEEQLVRQMVERRKER